ncbi:hypothetical protein CK203_037330 [Vitis vinifera]|uniref:Uncharacterized protein n=1 Tax=Vitis vinifera TaxID=29760 RepID=A0A438D4Q9_VITVI|nr:hypothetical protein CK203_088836 [Vitis vinifera]RVW80939.1 hypothetical protein CK203_037330 [Vitis vinifera]
MHIHILLFSSVKELACERECSRGEDYRLIKLTITDFSSKREQTVIVECRGHDAARFHSIDRAHGWEMDVVGMVEQKHGKNKIVVSFECETLKADKAAEDHIRQFMPKLAGLDAVGASGCNLREERFLRRIYSGFFVNIGRMSITGLDLEAAETDDTETAN